jgi:hypothetical protein
MHEDSLKKKQDLEDANWRSTGKKDIDHCWDSITIGSPIGIQKLAGVCTG